MADVPMDTVNLSSSTGRLQGETESAKGFYVTSTQEESLETDRLCEPSSAIESDYDNLDSDEEPNYETVSLLDEGLHPQDPLPRANITRSLSLNLKETCDGYSLKPSNVRYSTGTFPAVRSSDSHSDHGAVVVHVTSGRDETERSWSRLKSSTKEKSASSSKRSSRTEEDPSLNPKLAVSALAAERIRHLSGRSQPSESPFGYKNWLLHLARKKRCEILILTCLLMWLSFFIVLAIVLNGNLLNGGEPSKENDVIEFTSKLKESNASSRNGFVTRLDKDPVLSNTGPNQNVETKYESSTRDAIAASTTTNVASSDFKISTTIEDEAPLTIIDNSKTTIRLQTGKNVGAVVPQLQAVTDATNKRKGVNAMADMGEILYPSSVGFVNITSVLQDKDPNYLVGVGRSDITGPAADVNMMGYANPNQVSGGIHIRQYARAFIVQDPSTKIRTVFVNIDACMGSTLVKLEVLKLLKATFGDLYTAENLCISGTHTHSAPAGFLQDVLFQISSWGYVQETLSAMVKGIVESIRKAHDNMQPGFILLNKGQLLDSNINRSPMSYINNPASERARYPFNVDKDMTLLKFVDKNGEGMGMINWFPVHCTSMNNTNSLISSDNKGYAALLFEEYMDPGSLPGASSFVAAFAQSNEGDVSPNTKGPHCIDTGEPCDNIQSTCNGKVQNCIASGPGKDMFESTKIIGNNQFLKAKELYGSASVVVNGPVDTVQQYIDMTEYKVSINQTNSVKLCKPAMGFSFAAGTTDGPGAFDFKQGDKSGKNHFWQIVRNFLHSPSEEQVKCHSPKPILLDTGEMERPYEWQPSVVDTQLIRIGNFLMIAVPGEFSTMAGRRVRNGVLETFFKSNQDKRFEGVIAGLSNTYSDYITTFEEYQIQRYEGASTIYGPYTEKAYVEIYKNLAKFLIKGEKPTSDTHPENIKENLYEFLPGVVYDSTPFGSSMGDVIDDAKPNYIAGDKVIVKFVSGNPRNSLEMQPNVTFLTVERGQSDGSWEVVHTDSSWETKYIWKRTSTILGRSEVTIIWETSPDTDTGTYRITHYGHYKYMWGGIYPYSGRTKTFKIERKS